MSYLIRRSETGQVNNSLEVYCRRFIQDKDIVNVLGGESGECTEKGRGEEKGGN